MRRRSVSTKARTVFAETKEVSATSLRSKSAVNLDRLLLTFLLLCQVDIHESSLEGNTKFNFLGIFWESKRSWRHCTKNEVFH